MSYYTLFLVFDVITCNCAINRHTSISLDIVCVTSSDIVWLYNIFWHHIKFYVYMSHMEYYFENFEALTKLVVEIPEPLATQQFFTGPQVIGTSWYNNPESLAKARINILMWRAIQLYNLPQGKVPSTQRTSLWPNLYLLYFSLLWQMLHISFGSTPHHLSLSQICDLSTLSSFCAFTSPKGSEIRDY